jgi:ankyrin repeat protein
MFNFKYLFYLVVFACISVANAGSYDDFFQAIKTDNVAVVNQLLARGFDPNSVGPNGQTGLILAIKGSNFKVVAALVDHPLTNVEVRTAQDESPLMLAALNGNLALCEKLIARDADVNKPGWAPLHYAATGAHLKVMQLLLDHSAYIDAESPNGSTPLMMAAMYGNAESVDLLLKAGADPTLKNSLGLTAVDFAVGAERPDSVELIAAAIRKQKYKGAW